VSWSDANQGGVFGVLRGRGRGFGDGDAWATDLPLSRAAGLRMVCAMSAPLRGRFGGVVMAILSVAVALALLGTGRSSASLRRAQHVAAHRPPRPTTGSGGALVPSGMPGVTVDPGVSGSTIPAGFLGLSFEYWAEENYAGKDPRAVDPVLVQLIRNLVGQDAISGSAA
jgi:hypothetical protein